MGSLMIAENLKSQCLTTQYSRGTFQFCFIAVKWNQNRQISLYLIVPNGRVVPACSV